MNLASLANPNHRVHFVAKWLGYAASVLIIGSRLAVPGATRAADEARPPNIILIFADDLGYADLGVYGAEGYATPHLDRMASEGVRFTDFYVAQAVCSASRAALLSGCYSNRVGILGALGPGSAIGVHESEVLIPEVLKPLGYATAIVGKWHLGDRPEFLPTSHGFDEYFGLPYSNDMWPQHPTNPNYPPLPLLDGEQPVELNPDQRQLTTRYTERAVRFIEQAQGSPFFLYVAHSMPHVPLFVSEKHEGATERGLFGDVIAEIDWSVGEILDAVRRAGIDEETLVIFTSDNGPWLSYGDHAGSAGILREGKGTSFEGGVREPFIARWPGTIPAGTVCHEPTMTIDLLPTIARLAGAEPPRDRVLDGHDIAPLLLGEPGARSPHVALYFYYGGQLEAVRAGKWKLHLPHAYRSLQGEAGSGGIPGPYVQKNIELSLFDLDSDPGESTDVSGREPQVVEQLLALAEVARQDLGDTATGQLGANVRDPGRVHAAE